MNRAWVDLRLGAIDVDDALGEICFHSLACGA
jgi:hypothetical protein